MPRVSFSQYHYYPALLSSVGEHIGYRELPDQDKARLIPILELSQRGNAPNLDESIAAIRETSGQRPFILDLCKEPAPAPYVPRDPSDDQARIEREAQTQAEYNEALANLLSPADGFSAWRRLVAAFRNAVPTLQHTDISTQARQILRQAALLSRGDQCIAIRLTQETGDAIYSVIPQIISVLESPDRLLIIVDCGHARRRISDNAEFAVNALTHILTNIDIAEQPLVRAVCMSNSFPRPSHDGLRSYQSFDWDLWREVRESFPLMFGDYAAMHRIRRPNTFVPPDRRATVVLPLDEEWLIYRHPNVNDDAGWIDGSRIVVADSRFATVDDIWGTRVIRQAATGDLNGINFPRFWYAAKVNIHIHRQMDYARNNVTNYGTDENDE